VGFKDQN